MGSIIVTGMLAMIIGIISMTVCQSIIGSINMEGLSEMEKLLFFSFFPIVVGVISMIGVLVIMDKMDVDNNEDVKKKDEDAKKKEIRHINSLIDRRLTVDIDKVGEISPSVLKEEKIEGIVEKRGALTIRK